LTLVLYNISLSLYAVIVRIYSLFNDKAKKWVAGRENWEDNTLAALSEGEKRIWIHCSSMGEFEQARPVIEVLKEQYPSFKIVVTFFSPSGYEACKKSDIIDYVFYLPSDSRSNAKKFIAVIDPSLAIFVKYEFWYHYLVQLKKEKIPVVLVSGAFRQGQAFFKWYGNFFRKMLGCFSFFFLQDDQSKKLLNTIGIDRNILITGDTRYDRVSFIAKNIMPVPAVDNFKQGHKILICGSTWPEDEKVIKDCIDVLPTNWKLIIAPHEVGDEHIRQVLQLFGSNTILYSELDAENTGHDKKILIVNNIGMLSCLFAYGDIAFIGGGFRKGGIHNILEPAVFGLPVLFGPVYQKFVEAVELISLHYVFSVNNVLECRTILGKLITDDAYRDKIGKALKTFMQQHTGATDSIIREISKEKWLN
jgi:3-deoxy-D-manno-octulosonic-acid transferase